MESIILPSTTIHFHASRAHPFIGFHVFIKVIVAYSSIDFIVRGRLVSYIIIIFIINPSIYEALALCQ